jgi:gliding motility-associated-like protein
MNFPSCNFLTKYLPIVLCFFGCCCSIKVTAQLTANFTTDKQGGCSPLNVKFTNTTTSASATATWQWSFGNGNTSTLKDPGATYFTEKTFSVTLTVKDGSNSSYKTMDIVVYKKPTVDFTVSPAKGCVPLDVNFTANATPGDGTLANYLWDFGDGETVQGSTYKTTQHTYTFPQTPPVTLNVTNSYGCYTTITKTNQVEAVKGVVASFTPSTYTLCNTGESINFLNSSTGSGTLNYQWDFGDGGTSTDQSPIHVFNTKGSYSTKLITASSDGCSATLTSAIINVANFTADFDVPAKICADQYVTFNNKSTKPFDRAEWWVDNSSYGYSYYDGNFSTSFSQPGEHTIKLIVYGTCSVTVTKKVTVNKTPLLTGFIAELQGACGVPVKINYKDTSSEAVAWEWKNYYYGSTFASTQNSSYTYTSGDWEYVYLTVTNAAGCSNTVSKYINYAKPNVFIIVTTPNYSQGCTGLVIGFAANSDTTIKDYSWNFGDGSALTTEKSPTHIFNKAGYFTVSLNYTTNNGCKGIATFNNVIVVDKPGFDFTSKSGTVICGNTPDTLVATPALGGWSYYWSFNDEYTNYYYGNSTIIKQFNYDTTYTVKMIAVNNSCSDTVIKTDYIKVLPPFPHIQQVFNTCDGTRGDVTFTENSVKALQWKWNFGDGGSDNYSSFKDTIRHSYTKTGSYKVVLSAVNGGCTVRDSTTAYVLLKQKPLLTAQKTDACGSDIVNFKLSGFEINPYNYAYSNYYLSYKEYGDFTACNAVTDIPYYYWQQEVSGTLQSLDPGKNNLRMITTSYSFGCADTSNFIPLKIHGPKAGFKMEPHSGCFKDAVAFTDTSQKFGAAAIVKWEWDFGDNKTQTLTDAGSTTHLYSNPGYYYVRLKITDANGCINQTEYYLHYITVDGPKADFSASAFTVPPNTTVYFYNTSAFYNSYYSSSLQWLFSDGTTYSMEYPSFNYTAEGNYPVKLTTRNSVTGCTDTIQKTIAVRKVNSAFTYRLSYINNNSCPPVIASFTSISTNASRVSWDFGDGGVAANQQNVSHTYNEAGIYRVVHYSFDSNNAVDSTEDYIEVKGPYALLKADMLTGCSSLQVTLTAEVKNASNYTWDFGDGTVVPTTDTFAVHTYLTPGIYIPALILKDGGGCSATSELPEKIIVDSLYASFKIAPSLICDSAFSVFIPDVKSLSNDQLQSALQYKWVVKQLNITDTLYGVGAGYQFNIIGTHAVSLIAETAFGCQQKITDSVYVKEGVNAFIAGPDKLCQNDVTTFTGSAIPSNNLLQWKWDFGNGAVSDKQNPVPQTYSNTGVKQVSLIVSNGFCGDTAAHPLMINPHPVIGFTPSNPFVCKGNSITLTASGGINYQWRAANLAIINPGNATISSSPANDIFYTVNVTDTEGCSSKDSVQVKVVQPFNVNAPASLFACEGSTVQLNASGTDNYKWINNTAGINNASIANPTAVTSASVTYTVVGYDSYSCFTDTADLFVRVSKLSVVDAGQDHELIAGTAIRLAPLVDGAVNWGWSPADYLSCTACLNPVSTPKSSTIYTFTAYNADGCTSKDEVTLKLICKSNLVFIPGAFTPNNDNLNDQFNITGSGIKSIRSIIIYNRWGKVMFERKNININDRSNSWDGYYNGEPMPAGAYVYFIKAACEGGDIFDYRGTIMLLR